MTEPSVARFFTALLTLTCPVLAHLAVARGSAALTAASLTALGLAILLPHLIARRALAWLALPLVLAGCIGLSRSHLNVLPLYFVPVCVPALLAWVFGRTLVRGRTPLIAQLIQALHPPGSEPPADAWPYARRLTLAWAVFLTALGAVNLGLAALAKPNGLLLAAGLAPSFTVPLEWWSWFANVIGYLLIAAFFLIEYAYRRSRFPEQPYRNMLDFLRRLAVAMPRLLGRPS